MHIGLNSGEYPQYPLGGAGAQVTNLARGLVREGHEVSVVGIYPPNRGLAGLIAERIDGVRVIRIPSAPQWMRRRPGLLWERYQLSAQLRRLHREQPLDLFEFIDGRGFGVFGGPPGVALAVRLDGNVRIFDEAQGINESLFCYWMERRTLKNARFHAAPSQFARDAVQCLFGLAGRDCEIIYNAVDTDLFSPGSIEHVPGLIVCTNSIEPGKGVLEMIQAMNEIAASHPRARLVFVGRDTRANAGGGTYSEWLLNQAKPEYRERITFIGQVDRSAGVLEYLRKAAICCYPSRVETDGVAPLEAMAVGKPVISGEAGPGPELIEHGVSGLLCDALSPESIAAAVKRIFEEPGLADRLGRNARERAVEKFASDAWIDRNIEYYETSVAAHRKSCRRGILAHQIGPALRPRDHAESQS